MMHQSKDGRPIYALSIRQPWASAIVDGPKRIENRTWQPPFDLIGERIWIHAAATYDVEGHESARKLWPVLDKDPTVEIGSRYSTNLGAVLGSARIAGFGSDKFFDVYGKATEDIFEDPWWSGPYGWLLDDVIKLRSPIPSRGYQKLWVPDDALLRQLNRTTQLSRPDPKRERSGPI